MPDSNQNPMVEESSLSQYFRQVIESHRHVHLQALGTAAGLVAIDLEDVYTAPLVTGQYALGLEQVAREKKYLQENVGAWSGSRSGKYEGPITGQNQNREIHKVLSKCPKLVVLGKPGSGKTTFLQYLALTFAHDLLGHTEYVESRLQMQETRMPILLSLREFSAYLQRNCPEVGANGSKYLSDYLRIYFTNQDLVLPDRFFTSPLERGECIVLLDGLDEITDPSVRYRVVQVIERFTCAYPNNRFVVTCRDANYLNDDVRLGAPYTLATICELAEGDFEGFVQCWNNAFESVLEGARNSQVLQKANAQTAHLMGIFANNPRIQELVTSPLLLTVITLAYRYRNQLTEHRAELYEEVIGILLSNWDIAKGLSLAFTVVDCLSTLGPIALWMMEHQTREIEAEELTRQLNELFCERLSDRSMASKAAESFLKSIKERSGLLIEQDQGVYAFSHLAFQEYLAACEIANKEKDEYMSFALKHLTDIRWREVIVLEAGYLSRRGKTRVTALINSIMDYKVNDRDPFYHLELAAECLYEVGQFRVNSDLRGELRGRLLREFEQPTGIASPAAEASRILAARKRSAAARVWARLESFPYKDQPTFWHPPYGEPVWVEIPSGDFWMGGRDFDETKPEHPVYLDDFRIAKTPITNQQYALFVLDCGYPVPSHWEWGRIPSGLESHPVTNVTWQDAVKYCEWLSQVTGKVITLPNEAQWEKSARGPIDKRTYPWGEEWDVICSNSIELGLRATTRVGIFPQGASSYGCLDMVGNVWEWTHSRWGSDAAVSSFTYPFVLTDGREDTDDSGMLRVSRGGSFVDARDRLCCAYRNRVAPDLGLKFLGFRVIAAP